MSYIHIFKEQYGKLKYLIAKNNIPCGILCIPQGKRLGILINAFSGDDYDYGTNVHIISPWGNMYLNLERHLEDFDIETEPPKPDQTLRERIEGFKRIRDEYKSKEIMTNE